MYQAPKYSGPNAPRYRGGPHNSELRNLERIFELNHDHPAYAITVPGLDELPEDPYQSEEIAAEWDSNGVAELPFPVSGRSVIPEVFDSFPAQPLIDSAVATRGTVAYLRDRDGHRRHVA